jgi:hypothetical protein
MASLRRARGQLFGRDRRSDPWLFNAGVGRKGGQRSSPSPRGIGVLEQRGDRSDDRTHIGDTDAANDQIRSGPASPAVRCERRLTARADFDEIARALTCMFELAAGAEAQLTTFTLGKAFVVANFPDWHLRCTDSTTSRERSPSSSVRSSSTCGTTRSTRGPICSAPDHIHFSTSGQAVMASEW